MKNLRKCIESAVAQGHITEDEAAQFRQTYDTILKQTGSPEDAKAGMVAEIEAMAAQRQRVAGLMARVREKLAGPDGALFTYRNLRGEADPAEAFLMLHESMGRMGSFVQDAESLRKVIQRGAQGKLEDLLYEFRRGAITGDLRRARGDVRDRLENVVRELFGTATGDAAAKALADAWTQVAEELRVRYNDAGGMIGKLERWGLPQGHDQQALLDFGREPWIERMMQPGVLDRERMINPLTQRRLSDEELRESLEVAYDRITTDGWIDREASGVPVGRGALWKQHADHRFLHFKDADAWLAYAKDFGNRDPFGAMMGHINRMARDIAHMETFGPNPNVMRNYLRQVVTKEAATRRDWGNMLADQVAEARVLVGRLGEPPDNAVGLVDQIAEINREMAGLRRRLSPAVQAQLDALNTRAAALEQAFAVERYTNPADQATADALTKLFEEMRDPLVFSVAARKAPERATRLLDRADGMWELQRGSLTPVSASFANAMASTRNVISTATLGGAFLSSLSDPVFGQDARMRFGMGMARANFAGVAIETLKELITRGNRRDAVRAKLGLDGAIDVMHRTARENLSWDARAWTGYMVDRNLTWTFLTPWTQSGKHQFGTSLMAWMADLSDRPHAALPESTRRALADHGIDAAAWEAIRTAPKHEPKAGALWLRANEIEAHAGRELAERYAAMILRETTYAVPEATVWSRSLAGSHRPGSLTGEMWRSAAQFKGFGIAVAQLYALRIAREIMAGDPSAPRRAAALVITSAFLGGIAMALKDMKDGRDPRKWLDEKTYADWQMWGAAMLQAGGLGIYGDFLFSNTGRHGQSLQSTLAGPLVDRVDNVIGLTMGNVAQAYRGDRTNAGREATRFLRQNVPYSNMWWLGPTYQRVLMDSLQRRVDPEAYAQFRQQIMRRRRDYGQEFWWAPGEVAPRRPPNMSRIMATQ